MAIIKASACVAIVRIFKTATLVCCVATTCTSEVLAAPRTKYGSSPNKYVVCSITINSDDEIRVFKDKCMSTKEFEFIELTPDQGETLERGQSWFAQACQSLEAQNKKCDVLVISGHFGGTFFGKSRPGITLSLDEVEERGCAESCKNILNPSEAFLFGCNTLAGKEKDTRTPEEYLNILIEDGIERDEAERVVEARYGMVGDSFRDRMRRAFSGVPHIYGFDSIGPSGANVKKLLSGYCSKIGNYAKHLNEIEGSKAARLADNALRKVWLFNRKKKSENNYDENEALSRSLKITNFAQCSGVDESEVGYEVNRSICSILDDSLSVVQKMSLVERLLKDSNRLTYLPAIEKFFSRYPPPYADAAAAESFDRIVKNDEARTQIFSLIKNLKYAIVMTIELASLCRNLGWYSATEFNNVVGDKLKEIFKNKVNAQAKDIICSLPATFDYSKMLMAKDINPENFVTVSGLEAIDCLDLSDPVLGPVYAKSLKSTSPGVRVAAAEALGMFNDAGASADVALALAEALKDENESVAEAAAIAFYRSGQHDPQYITLVIEALDVHPGDYALLNQLRQIIVDAHPADDQLKQIAEYLTSPHKNVRRVVAEVFSGIKVKPGPTQTRLIEMLSDSDSSVREAVVRALSYAQLKSILMSDEVAKRLNDDVYTVRLAAADFFITTRTRDALVIEKLQKLTQDPYETVRIAAINALRAASARDDASIAAIIDRLSDTQSEVVAAAGSALEVLKPGTRDQLLKLVALLDQTQLRDDVSRLLKAIKPHDAVVLQKIRDMGFVEIITW